MTLDEALTGVTHLFLDTAPATLHYKPISLN